MAASPPLFLIGVARSGTTLLSLMLDGHSRLAIPYESHFIPRFARRLASFGDLASASHRRRLVEAVLAEPYVAAWDQVPALEDLDLDACTSLAGTIDQVFSAYARLRGKDLWGDKTPAYVTEIDVLHRLFPDARYAHIIRDGRDVALSLVRQWWGPGDFVTAIRRWRDEVNLARKMLRMLPDDQYREVRFEDFVDDPERHLKSVLDLLDLGFEPAMATAYQDAAPSRVGDRMAAHHANLGRPPSADQCHKWKKALGPADQAIAHEIAGPLLRDLGYEAGRTTHPLKVPQKLVHRVREAVGWRTKGKRPAGQ